MAWRRRRWWRRCGMHEQLLDRIDAAMQDGPYLAGVDWSLADAAADALRLAARQAQARAHVGHGAGVAAWYERIRARPSFKTAVEDWLTAAEMSVCQRARSLAEGARGSSSRAALDRGARAVVLCAARCAMRRSRSRSIAQRLRFVAFIIPTNRSNR